ncbi:MAG: ALF repeat-containing protein, partial [Pseudonocardiaceae bacterium]
MRELVVDIAELSPEPEVRDAAAAALASTDPGAIPEFLDHGEPAAQAAAKARKEHVARNNRTAVERLTGTGGPIFNAEVTAVLAGSDDDREAFLLYGKDIAADRDRQEQLAVEELAERGKRRVLLLVGIGGPEVKRAAQAALDSNDQAVIETFLNTGYLAVAKADADAHEQHLQNLEEAQKAAEALSETAKKAARAADARRLILVAHGDALKALQRSSNAMVSAANSAREAEKIYSAGVAGGHRPEQFDVVKSEVARQLGYAVDATTAAQSAAAAAAVNANILVETGHPYGTEWAKVANALALTTQGATKAAETAKHTIDATAAAAAAVDAGQKAQAHAEKANQWRLHAEEQARTAAAIAEAARQQAVLAQEAAARTKTARIAAEQAAWAAAARTRAARLDAEREQGVATAARAHAEAERKKAAAARARAQSQAMVAARARSQAQVQVGIAARARARAEAEEGKAAHAENTARTGERDSVIARSKASIAELVRDDTAAIAAAKEAVAAAARAGSAGDQARTAATEARKQANIASGA